MIRFVPQWKFGLTQIGFGLAVFAVLAQGCGDGTQSTDEAIKKAREVNPAPAGSTATAIGKFEGTLTIDGEPPDKDATSTLIILNDPAKPQNPSEQPAIYVGVDKTGHFAGSTLKKGDGLPSGKYIVTFVQLHQVGARWDPGFREDGPDELKNLYNDPDVNASIPEFNIEITPEGRTDWHWNLVTKGKTPNSTPGPHAITRIAGAPGAP